MSNSNKQRRLPHVHRPLNLLKFLLLSQRCPCTFLTVVMAAFTCNIGTSVRDKYLHKHHSSCLHSDLFEVQPTNSSHCVHSYRRQQSKTLFISIYSTNRLWTCAANSNTAWLKLDGRLQEAQRHSPTFGGVGQRRLLGSGLAFLISSQDVFRRRHIRFIDVWVLFVFH